MNPINYLIIDDEPLAHKSLELLLKNYEQLQCIGNCLNAFKAIAFIKENKPDLIFLDMDMPDMNGMDLLKNINQPINVIITTAHSDYALEGYDYGIIDFLVKPIKAERLFKAITKVFDIFNNITEKNKNIEKSISNNETQNYVFGTIDKKIFEKIYFNDILFIEKIGNYLYIHTTNGKSYYYLTSLKTIMSILPKEEFSFINQSIIISKSKVDCPDGQNVVIKENLAFKISPAFKEKNS